MREVGKTNRRDRTEIQPFANRQPKLLDFPLTHRKHSTSHFLIDNFERSLAFTVPKHSSAEAGHSPLISNRPCPRLETPVSHRKQTIAPTSNRPQFAFFNSPLSSSSASLAPLLPASRTLIANGTHSRESSSSCKHSTYKILIANEFHLQNVHQTLARSAKITRKAISVIIDSVRKELSCPSTNMFATTAMRATRKSSRRATEKPSAPSVAASARRSSSPPSLRTPATAAPLQAMRRPNPQALPAAAAAPRTPAAATEQSALACVRRSVLASPRLNLVPPNSSPEEGTHG
jgi:hypothetical protein